MWKMCNNEGYHEDTLHSIVKIWFGKNTVKDGFIYNHNGKRVLKKTTRGVDLLCALKSGQNDDGSDRIMKTWHPLTELKESYPVKVAEFAVARGVDKMPAFAWWVSCTLKKRDRIIASVRSRIARTTHKYGIKIPTSWKHAKDIDAQNKNHL